MIPLIVIRPQPGAEATVAAATKLPEFDVRAFPLFKVQAVNWTAPMAAEVDALLIGSANAIRHAGPQLAQFLGKPAYAVGRTTAACCEDAGLVVVETGRGGLNAVLAGISGPRRLLRLAGREHLELRPAPGVELAERIVYSSDPQPMPAELAKLLRKPAIVALHSAIAAEHFAAECDRLEVPRGRIALATIGPRVSAACGPGWAEVATAITPHDAALLAQARHLCQNRDQSPGHGTQ